MRSKLIAVTAIGLALALPAIAGASTGPKRVQALAAAQTIYLFEHLNGEQIASPATCGEGQPASGFLGWYLLPTLSFTPGNAHFDCRITARKVVLDLGGLLAIEDASDMPYTFEDGTLLLFRAGNLERICDDVRPRFVAEPAVATLDGDSIAGTAVTTPEFPVHVQRTAPLTFWADSVALGHPGVLASTFCGWKAEVPLTRGKHVIAVDLSALTGTPTHFRYDITVR